MGRITEAQRRKQQLRIEKLERLRKANESLRALLPQGPRWNHGTGPCTACLYVHALRREGGPCARSAHAYVGRLLVENHFNARTALTTVCQDDSEWWGTVRLNLERVIRDDPCWLPTQP